MTSIYASKTRLGVALAIVLCAASCRPNLKSAPPPHGPPPAYIVVRHSQLSLRASAPLELHAMLAAAARNDEALPAPFEPARAAYARALRDDEDDAIVRETTRGLDRGFAGPAANVLEPFSKHGLANVFVRAEEPFGPEWETRSRAVWAAIARATSALDDTTDAVLVTLARDLGITFESDAPFVDLVSESPPAARKALIAPLLAARGACFAEAKDTRVNNARIGDCIVVRALLSGRAPPGFGERFFTVLVVHAVAVAMTTIEPRHVSVDRRSVNVVEPDLLAFLAKEWHGGAVTPELERRYREQRDPRERASAPSEPASR